MKNRILCGLRLQIVVLSITCFLFLFSNLFRYYYTYYIAYFYIPESFEWRVFTRTPLRTALFPDYIAHCLIVVSKTTSVRETRAEQEDYLGGGEEGGGLAKNIPIKYQYKVR